MQQNIIPDYALPQPPRTRTFTGALCNFAAKSVLAYFILSALTLPLMNRVWLGELPPLALIQAPKTLLADSLRTRILMPAIRALGWSRGSFSPDYILTRPYALAAAYLLPLLFVLILRLTQQTPRRPRSRWLWLLALAAAVDFCMMLEFAHSPGLTIY